MRRRIARAAWLLLALQIGAFLLLRSQEQRSLASNVIQVLCCFTAAAFSFSAAWRSRDLARTFWGLFFLAFLAYGTSDIVWTYYENWLHATVPSSPISQFLYLC